MPRLKSAEIEQQAAKWATYLMASSARTAPKARGVDDVCTAVLDSREDIEELAKAMEEQHQAKKVKIESFPRDASLVRRSAAVLLVGVKGTMPKKPDLPLNCGACGCQSCNEFMALAKKKGEDFSGPLCFFQTLDLGIALGSAARMAAEFNMDNRMMFTIGGAARKLGLLEADAIIGIPLSVAGKNIFFDRDQGISSKAKPDKK